MDSKTGTKQSLDTSSHDEVELGYVEHRKSLSGFQRWLNKLSVETGGIERITDEVRAKNSSKVWNACTFW